ncbi:MAG: LamG domain-containing protein [Sulfuriferula multivorans]|uniref:LamG domain-containing protein n=1 Tax=Sulfuriferula multivorans TaxID=1559896 RepID=A0A7C9P8H4_9PROT|nr:LamG domain-containing protein [Sulfuriferula multivorans]
MKRMTMDHTVSAYRMHGPVRFGLLAFLALGGALLFTWAEGQAHAATYANVAAPYSWVSPSAHTRAAWTSGTSCSSGYVGAAVDDDITAQLPLGFTFNFGGVNYTQVQIMSNGRLQFNNGFCGYGTQTVGPPPTYPYPYPNASVVRTMRVYGTDLDPTSSGAAGICPAATCYVSYATEGTAPNRRFVATWVNVPEWGSSTRTGSFNLQVVLEETTNEFVYQFGASNHPTGGSAQIGWSLTTTDFDVWSTPVVPPASSAVRFFIPAPVAEFRFDEANWSGAGSVANSTGGGTNGSPVGSAQTVPAGRICYGGNIPSNTSSGTIDAINTGYDVDSQIGSSGTITFWYKSNGAWSGGGSNSVQLLDASVVNNRWFYLARQNLNGKLSFILTDNANNDFQVTTGNLGFAANTWVHIGVTWKLTPIAANNRLQIFINGALSQSAAMGTVQPLSTAIGTLYVGDNRSAFVTNPGTGNSADGVIDEVRLYNSEVTGAVILRDSIAARSCAAVSVAPAGFNAFESSTTAGSVTGVIKTKVAASGFGHDVVALKTGGTAIETAFAGDVKVELVDASSAASCGAYALIRNLGTMTFSAANSGRKTLPGISEANAWPNARVRMTYPATGAPTIVGCSTDPFAIRPANFGSATATDVNSAAAGGSRALANIVVTGGNVHKAGQPFQIEATARNNLGATTTNYTGSPVPTLTGCVLPSAGCVLGGLTASTWTATSGVVKTLNATYSEVGTITMKLVDSTFAAVDAADGSTAAERNIESVVFNVGRFVPDHFDLVPASTPIFKTFNTTACSPRTFTYIGQPFGYVTVPQATIMARNAAGATTVNYRGTLWKLDAAGVTPVYTPLTHTLDGVPGLATVTPSATMPGTGLLVTNSNDKFFFQRTLPEVEFVADISLSISIGDSSENAVVGNNIIETLTPANFPSIAFDAGNSKRMLFGRLQLSNAHGAEMLNLPIPIETQVWNGVGFTRNTEDFCTQIVALNVELSNWQRDLNPCETSVSLTGRFIKGKGNLRLSAPGTATTLNTGSVDLRVHLGATGSGSTCVPGVQSVIGADQTWLQGKGSGAAWDKDPVARGSFGLYRGSKPLIYIREMY